MDEDARRAAVKALAADMQQGGRGRDDPVRTVFGMLGDRWTMLILLTLGIGTWRHAELKREVGELAWEDGISQRVLTEKLRALERNGFAWREVSDDVPPRVTYGLTAEGRGLLAQAGSLLAWVKAHQALIADARAQFDARDGE